jgi:CHU_C Type IX secretion signal domain
MTVTTPTANVTDYKWKVNNQDQPAGDGKTFLVVNPQLGTTLVTISAKVGDCPGSASTNIIVNPLPRVVFPIAPFNSVCTGGSIILNTQPNAGITYNWTGAGITTPTSSAPSVIPPADNTKYVVSMRNPITGCTKVDSTIIRVAVGSLAPIPKVDACSTNPNPTITAVGTDNIGNGKYSWSPSGVSTNGASITVSATTNATYTVTYTYGNNCTTSTSVVVTSVPGFNLRINPDTFSSARLIDQGTPITLTAVGTGNTGTLSYAWMADAAAVGTTQTITFPALIDATYKVTATSSTGCKKDTSVRVSIRYPNYKLPNAFTPNGDTINSHFGLIFNGLFPPAATNPRPEFWKGRIEVTSYQVFNRWGQEVYGETSTNVLNAASYKGWNGKKSGKEDGSEAASDVYVYLIKLKMPDGSIKAESGELNLIR